MDSLCLQRLEPDLRMLMEELKMKGVSCRLGGQILKRHYQGARLYTPAASLREDLLYVLRPEDTGRFPADAYPYLSTVPVSGMVEHLFCPGEDPVTVLDHLLNLFSRLHQLELELNQLVYQNVSLQELCEAGARILENPICVHDDWFIMIAMTQDLPEVVSPDYIMSSNKAFVPQAVIEDFKFDSEYLETYTHHSAQYWNNSPEGFICLYVNMWEGTVYRGRLLVVEHKRPFRRMDYMLAEVLTQRATILLRQKHMGEENTYRSMDDIVYDMLQGKPVMDRESAQFLSMMGWGREDSLQCIRLRAQQTGVTPVTEHMLHSDLFRGFPGSYIMFAGNQQCVIMNVDREKDMRKSAVRQRLVPLCRDYCQFAGLSSPVKGIGELHIAFHQAEVAVERLLRVRDHRWLTSFSDCVLDYILYGRQLPMESRHLISPDLLLLQQHDARQGTQYFETLRTYLLLERSIPRTAEALIIHRTTLLYRLKKIQELTELDLNDQNVRLYLQLSLKILDEEHPAE